MFKLYTLILISFLVTACYITPPSDYPVFYFTAGKTKPEMFDIPKYEVTINGNIVDGKFCGLV